MRRKRHKLLLIVTATICILLLAGYLFQGVLPKSLSLEDFSSFQSKVSSISKDANKSLSDLISWFSFSKLLGFINKTDSREGVDLATIYRIGVVSDSHGYTTHLKSALLEMKAERIDMVIHLGDFTAGGEIKYFLEAKEVLQFSGLSYRVLPGDHDFNWVPEHSRNNYESVFGPSYDQVVEIGPDLALILFENSVIETGSSQSKKTWLEESLIKLRNEQKQAIFFSSKPLYNPYFTSKNDPGGDEILSLLEKYGVRFAFAGDTHIYSEYFDLKDVVSIVTVGAIGEYKNPLPQWVSVEVLEDYSLRVEPKPINTL